MPISTKEIPFFFLHEMKKFDIIKREDGKEFFMENRGFITIDQYENLQKKFKELQEKGPIHVNLTKGKKRVEHATTYILGIYAKFVCVQSRVNHYVEDFTISYSDLFSKEIVIDELDWDLITSKKEIEQKET